LLENWVPFDYSSPNFKFGPQKSLKHFKEGEKLLCISVTYFTFDSEFTSHPNVQIYKYTNFVIYTLEILI
jgi:hypothetical protein